MSKRIRTKLKDLETRTQVTEKKDSRFSYINPDMVIELLHQGIRLPQIAAIYGCSSPTVSYQVRKTYPDFDARKHLRWGRYDITVEDVVEMYQQFPSSTKIAKMLKVNTHAITERLEKAGIKRRSQRREDIKPEKVLSLYRIYKNTKKVGDLLNINQPLVRRRLNEAGISADEIREEKNRQDRQTRRTDIPTNQVLKYYDNGESINSIAMRYQASQGAIRRILVMNNREIRQMSGPASRFHIRVDLTPAKVARAYKKLKRISRVAKELGTTPSTVRGRLLEAGVEIDNFWRNKRARKDIPIKTVIRLHDGGESIRSIARRYQASPTTIERILSKYA